MTSRFKLKKKRWGQAKGAVIAVSNAMIVQDTGPLQERMLDMLLGIDLTQTQKDYGQTVQMCGRALTTLINDILDRPKIEAGKLELEAVPFDLRSLMDDMISLFSSKSREKCIECLYVMMFQKLLLGILEDFDRYLQI